MPMLALIAKCMCSGIDGKNNTHLFKASHRVQSIAACCCSLADREVFGFRRWAGRSGTLRSSCGESSRRAPLCSEVLDHFLLCFLLAITVARKFTNYKQTHPFSCPLPGSGGGLLRGPHLLLSNLPRRPRGRVGHPLETDPPGTKHPTKTDGISL